VRPTRAVLLERADFIQRQWGLPADKWVRVFKPVTSMTTQCTPQPAPHSKKATIPDPWTGAGWSSGCMSDGVISDEQATRTVARCAQAESVQHPLVRLASVSMRRASDNKPLDIEMLTQWLAARVGMDYLRIDPLKVDVGKVADAMGAVYAERHRILPWWSMPVKSRLPLRSPLSPIGWRKWSASRAAGVRRVLASPQEIHRLYGRVLCTGQVGPNAANKSGANNGASFEQLVELGKSNKQLDANDQSVVQVVDWLWQYAFDQRASDIHLEPRREQGVIRFRIDGVLAPGVPDAHGRAQRHDGAHQTAGAHGRDREAPPAGRPHQDPQPGR
jgi:hypothetical protein